MEAPASLLHLPEGIGCDGHRELDLCARRDHRRLDDDTVNLEHLQKESEG